MNELRDILHRFGVTYRVESRESRNKCIDKVIVDIISLLPKVVIERYDKGSSSQKWKEGYNQYRDDVIKVFDGGGVSDG